MYGNTSLDKLYVIITVRKRSMGQGNIFAPVVSLFIGGLPQCMLGYHTPLGPDTPLGSDTLQDQAPPWDQAPPCAVHAERYGEQGGGRHPSGMQACVLNVFSVPWEACMSSPCDNGGSCIDVNVDTFICMCRDGYFGITCGESTLLTLLFVTNKTQFPH